MRADVSPQSSELVADAQFIETHSAGVQKEWQTDRRRQIREYAGTFAAEFTVLACQIAVYKLAARFLGTVGFGEYAVARRTISLLQPIVLLGIGVALPRYIAMAEADGELDKAQSFFGAAVWPTAVAVGALAIAIVIGRGWFSYLFFGSWVFQALLPALAMALVGLSIHAICYAWFRGKMLISRANWLNLANLGLLPVIILLLFHRSTVVVLWGLAIGWTFVALFALAWTPFEAILGSHRLEQKQLLVYGIQRVPGDFTLMAMLAIPPLVAAHLSGIRVAGYVAFGVSITSMIASMFSPVGVILLPKVSANVRSGITADMSREIRLIGWLATLIPLGLIGVLEILAPFLIRIYLGKEFESAVRIIRIISAGALPLSVYYALRSVLDGFHDRAVNTVNLLWSISIFLALCSAAYFWRGSINVVLWSFVLSTTLLALLTVRDVRRIVRRAGAFPLRSGFAGSESVRL